MRLEGTYLFAAPREAVWEALMDPAVLAREKVEKDNK